MMSSTRFSRSLACALVLGAAALAPAAETPKVLSQAESRTSVGITIYNNGLGLVRERRKVDLPAGVSTVTYADVAERIDATSVAFKALGDAEGMLSVLEQNYSYDLVSPQALMRRFLDRNVVFERPVTGTKGETIFEQREGTLLGLDNGTVVKFGDEIVLNPSGTVVLRDLPKDLVSRPTLTWMLENRGARGSKEIEASYLTEGMTWRADYVAVVSAKDDAVDWTGWVTLDNQSGAAFENATLQLVAGEVQRVQEPQRYKRDMAMMEAGRAPAAVQQFEESQLFEYHLYTLQRPTDLGSKQTKQVSLMGPSTVKARKKLISTSPWYYQNYSDKGKQKSPVRVFMEFDNREEEGLGQPIPKGKVRAYKADEQGRLQFIGEDAIEHTPRNETVRVGLGEAFDIVVERTLEDYQQRSSTSIEYSFSIQVRNRKKVAETVNLIEHFYGDWTMISQSHPSVKRDAQTLEFEVPVEADGTVTVAYRVRVDY